MIRILIFAFAVGSFGWLAWESVHFHQVIRDDLSAAESEGERLTPGFIGGDSKILNFYYESIYRDLPSTLVPGCLLFASSVLLFLVPRRND